MHVSQAPLDEREKLSEIFWEKSVKTVDHLVSQPQVWLGLAMDKTKQQIDSLQNIVDNAAKQIVKNIKETSRNNILENTEHVNLQAVSQSKGQTNFGIKGSNLSLTINNHDEKVNNETSLVVLKSYNSSGCTPNRQRSCDAPIKWAKTSELQGDWCGCV